MGNHSKCFKCGELDEFCACIPASTAPTEPVRLSEEHPNLKVPTDPACSAKLDELGDDRGQGLDPYWKFGFRTGWHHGVRSLMASAAASGQQPTDCTEPNRAACPRLCQDFCNEAEVRKASEQQASVSELPPLPTPGFSHNAPQVSLADGWHATPNWYTGQQMHEYARAALSGRATIPSEADERALNEIFAAIDEAQRMNHYNESSFEIGKRVARLKCLADDFRAALTHRATTAVFRNDGSEPDWNAYAAAEGATTAAGQQCDTSSASGRATSKNAAVRRYGRAQQGEAGIPASGDTARASAAVPLPKPWTQRVKHSLNVESFAAIDAAKDAEIAEWRAHSAAIAQQGAAQAQDGEMARLWALHAAVSAIYLNDSSDFRSALGSVIRHLDPALAGEVLENPKAAYNKVSAAMAAPATSAPLSVLVAGDSLQEGPATSGGGNG